MEFRSGQLLVAAPFLQDPRFANSVVVLCGLTAENSVAFGLILNKPLEDSQQMFGGPAAEDKVFCLYDCSNQLYPGSLKISDRVAFVQDLNSFKEAGAFDELDKSCIRFYRGAATWETQRLEAEISEGGWDVHHIDAVNPFAEEVSMWRDFYPDLQGSLDTSIFPVIRRNVEQVSDEFEQSIVDLPEDQRPITRALTSDLSIYYVKDLGDKQVYLNSKYFAEAPGLNKHLLHRMAVYNLVDQVAPKVQLYGSLDERVMLAAGGNYESSLILSQGLMDYMHQQFEGDLVLAMPTRDVLLITRSNNVQGMQQIMNEVRSISETGAVGKLSNGLYFKSHNSSSIEKMDDVKT